MKPEPASAAFSHLDPSGHARMVDVGTKPDSQRTAIAEGRLNCSPSTIDLLRTRALPKGDVLTVAQIADIQAAKSAGTRLASAPQLFFGSGEKLLEEVVRIQEKGSARTCVLTQIPTRVGKIGFG